MSAFTRYSVESSRDEVRRELRTRYLEWLALIAACVVIAVMACLLVIRGLA